MIRIFDLAIAISFLILGMPILLILFIVGLLDTGSPIFSQMRIGKGKTPFVLYKFRTMKIGTQEVASHLANASSITACGRLMRATKLDELPQLWNVIKGDMSLVGPRPGLADHTELIDAREKFEVFEVRPGITGLAQVRGIDMSQPELLAEVDAEMISSYSTLQYFRLILITGFGGGMGDRVSGS